MKQFIKELCDKYDLHDIDVLVIKNNETVFEEMCSNKTINLPELRRTDLYRIASISKIFVGIAIMQLVEKGLITLDDNIEKYVDFRLRNPYFPNHEITIKHLVTHTSSLRDTSTNYVPYNEHSSELFDIDGMYFDKKMFSHKEPGSTFIYYNAGFHLLAIVIEKTSNERFDNYIENNILHPLNMRGSFNVLEDDTIQHIRPLFRKIDGVWVPQCDSTITPQTYQDYALGTNGSLFGPQGSMRSNAFELSKLMFDLMSENPKVLSKNSLDIMYQIHYLDQHKQIKNKKDFYRNSGIVFNIFNNESINKPVKTLQDSFIGHCGLAYGLHGMFFFDPIKQNGLIFNVTGEGKDMWDYKGTYSQYFAFQEDVFTYVNNTIWNK